MLRCGAYTDEVCINLINRRFVATWYDVAPPHQNAGDGWAFDQDAATFFGRPKPPKGHLRGATQEVSGRVHAGSYPAALFVSPTGEKLGEGYWGIYAPQIFLAKLKELMALHPRLFAPTSSEAATIQRASQFPRDAEAQLVAARLYWELAEWKQAQKCIARGRAASPTPAVLAELNYLHGRVAICSGNVEEALISLRAASKKAGALPRDLRDRILISTARATMLLGKHEVALRQWQDFLATRPDSVLGGEARYFSGLCHYKLGRKDKAKSVWRQHKKNWPWDRMARRSAASLGTDESEAFLNQELIDSKGWW